MASKNPPKKTTTPTTAPAVPKLTPAEIARLSAGGNPTTGGWQAPSSGSTPGVAGFGAGTLQGFQQMSVSPFLNYSEGELMPNGSPSLWGLDVKGPDAIYVQSADTRLPVPAGARVNRLLGDIADRLGIKPQKGKSTREQIVEHLATQYKLPKDQHDLPNVAERLGVQPEALLGPNSDATALFGIASKLGVPYPEKTAEATKDNTVSRKQVAQQFTTLFSANPDYAETLKAQLYEGGFYDADAYSSPTILKRIEGKGLDPYTMKAVGNMVNQAATAYNGGKGQKVTWAEFLQKAADGGSMSSAPGFSDQQTIQQLLANPQENPLGQSQKVPTEPLITGDQLLSSLQSAFENNLGRLPTAAELNQFVGQMNQMQQAKSAASAGNPNTPNIFDYDTGLTLAPGMPRTSYAAQEFARSDQPGFLQHQIANAGGQILDIIKGAGLGQTPNQVSAG